MKQWLVTMKKRRWLKIVLLVFILIFVYAAGSTISIWNYGEIDEKTQADVAIVLGAGTNGDEVSPVFKERINHGVWLYQNDYVDKILLTGGYGKGNEHSDAYVAKEYAIFLGIPKEDILVRKIS